MSLTKTAQLKNPENGADPRWGFGLEQYICMYYSPNSACKMGFLPSFNFWLLIAKNGLEIATAWWPQKMTGGPRLGKLPIEHVKHNQKINK